MIPDLQRKSYVESGSAQYKKSVISFLCFIFELIPIECGYANCCHHRSCRILAAHGI
jgi:hypothetical protein